MSDVFVVVEGPDMTYYGDAHIYGAYSTREEAEQRCLELWPDWTPDSCQWDNKCVWEGKIGQAADG